MYSYEIHFYNVPNELVEEIDNTFTYLKCETGFAATDWRILKTKDSFVAKFPSNKPFDLNIERALSNNLIYSLIGKEQFFSIIYYACIYSGINHADMDIFFVSDDKTKHRVILDKYCEMELSGNSNIFSIAQMN